MNLRAEAAEPTESTLVPMTEPRPFYWSVRRELWENRSLYVAPLVVTAFVLLGTLISLFQIPSKLATVPALDAAARHDVLAKPFSIAPAPIMLATLLIGLFYSLDALYGERRDRSLLFWKSLPVSDLVTVLSKAAIPIVVLPLIALALSLATVSVLWILGTLILAANAVSPAVLWGELRPFSEPVVMLYGLAVHALWFAPIYGWLLLVSAWARRLPLLWAALPLFAVSAVEGIASGGERFGAFLRYRVAGAMQEGFAQAPDGSTGGNFEGLSQLTPLRFLGAPGLWLGLLFAAACLAGATRLRRRREPI